MVTEWITKSAHCSHRRHSLNSYKSQFSVTGIQNLRYLLGVHLLLTTALTRKLSIETRVILKTKDISFMNLLAQWPSLHMPSTEICAEPTKLSLSTDLTHASEWASARKEPQTLRAAAECLLGPTASHPELQFLGINPAPALQVRTSQGKRANCRGVQLPIACCKACVVSNSSSSTTATQLTTLGHCRMSSAKLIRSSHIPQQGTGWRKQKGRDTANIIY